MDCGSENKFITSLSSFIFETSNNWNIQAITDCKLYIINRENHFKLNKTEPKWLEFDSLPLAYSFALLNLSIVGKEELMKIKWISQAIFP